MVKRFINAIINRQSAADEGQKKIPRSQRILLPVCKRPQYGYQVLQPAEGEHFLLEFNVATKVATRTLLRKMFPHMSYSDVHVYPEFVADGERYQPATFDWPVFEEMVNWDQFLALGWSFVPLDEHPEAAQLKVKINHPEAPSKRSPESIGA